MCTKLFSSYMESRKRRVFKLCNVLDFLRNGRFWQFVWHLNQWKSFWNSFDLQTKQYVAKFYTKLVNNEHSEPAMIHITIIYNYRNACGFPSFSIFLPIILRFPVIQKMQPSLCTFVVFSLSSCLSSFLFAAQIYKYIPRIWLMIPISSLDS